jgi:hypothetical protein
MKKYIVAALLPALTIIYPVASAYGTEKPTDASLITRQKPAIRKLNELVAGAGGFPRVNVDVAVGPHQISISVITKKGMETSAVREIQAARMIAAVENEISGKDEFGQVMVIHVNYVERDGKNAPLIQGYDFFKNPKGAFVLHKT